MNKVHGILADSRLFAGVDHDTLEQFSSRVSIRLVWKGEIVFNEADLCEAVGLVVSGQLAMQKYSQDGDYITVDLLGPGETFGEDLIFGKQREYTVSIEAVTNAQIVLLSRELLKMLLQSNPQLTTNYLGFLSDQIQTKNRRVINLSQRNIRTKITRYLLDLHEIQEQLDDEQYGKNRKTYVSTPSVELPVNKEVTARLLAMPRPSFSRELARMEDDGLLKVSGRVIWLTNLEGLETDGQDDEEDDDI